MKTLADHRRGGEQVIKHVHIDNRGGQAVVAETVVTGGSHENPDIPPYDQGAFGPTLLGSDAFGYGVPTAGDAGQEALPIARRAVAGRAGQ